MNMGEDNTHRSSIQDPLHKAIAALVRNTDERRDAGMQSGHTQLAGILNG